MPLAIAWSISPLSDASCASFRIADIFRLIDAGDPINVCRYSFTSALFMGRSPRQARKSVMAFVYARLLCSLFNELMTSSITARPAGLMIAVCVFMEFWFLSVLTFHKNYYHKSFSGRIDCVYKGVYLVKRRPASPFPGAW